MPTFLRGEAIGIGPNRSPQRQSGSWLGASDQLFQLREDLLDWVQVGVVSQQERRAGASGFDRLTNAGDLVTAEIVRNHDTAGREREELFNVVTERRAVDRTGRNQTPAASCPPP